MGPGFRLTIGTEPGGVARVTSAFAEFADAHALPDALRRGVTVALDELLSNTIKYGFKGRQGGEMTVAVEKGAERLSVTVTDDGRPFDPFERAAPDTTLTTMERRIGGLGIYLVQQMMDECSYQRQGDRNIVVLAKRLKGEK